MYRTCPWPTTAELKKARMVSFTQKNNRVVHRGSSQINCPAKGSDVNTKVWPDKEPGLCEA
jgi:hypothetical protein